MVAVAAQLPYLTERRRLMPTIIDIPGTTDSLVLEDYWTGPKVFTNLHRVRHDGTHVWDAPPPLPTSPDSWTQAALDGALVVAYSWSGFVVKLDLDSGREMSREFVK